MSKYFDSNPFNVSEEERVLLEEYVVRGIPSNLRRKFWLSVSGAYGYLKNYSDGYYQCLSKENDDIAFIKWPHPCYHEIKKDVKRTFSEEVFF